MANIYYYNIIMDKLIGTNNIIIVFNYYLQMVVNFQQNNLYFLNILQLIILLLYN